MKPRELLLLLLPCLLLVAVALLFRVRERTTPVVVQRAAPTGPFRVVIKKIEKVPTAAAVVAEGYDTSVRVLVGHTGIPARGWGKEPFGTFFPDTSVVAKRGAKWVRLMDNMSTLELKHGIHTASNGVQTVVHGIHFTILGFNKTHNAYEFVLSMRLRDVPPTAGALTLRTDFYYRSGPTLYEAVNPAAIAFLKRTGALHATAAIAVRGAGKVTGAPALARNPQLELRGVTVRALTASEKAAHAPCDTTAEFHLVYKGPLGAGGGFAVGNAADVSLRDEHGKRHIHNIIISSPIPAKNRDRIMPYFFKLNQAPLRGKVTLHAKVRANKYWPLDVQATVRER